MLWLVPCPMMGQVEPLREIHEKDYPLWSELHLREMSPDGKWISYHRQYESGVDTVFVSDPGKKITYSIPKGGYGFFGTDVFACPAENGTELIELTSGKRHVLPNTTRLSFGADGTILIFLASEQKELKLYSANAKCLWTVADVQEYHLSPDGKKVAYISKTNNDFVAMIICFEKSIREQTITSSGNASLGHLSWSKDSDVLSMFSLKESEGRKTSLLTYSLLDKKLLTLRDDQVEEEIVMKPHPSVGPLRSKDGTQVIFTGEPTAKPQEAAEVAQIWNAQDTYVYPFAENVKTRPRFHVYSWWPSTGKITRLNSDERPSILLTGDLSGAITWNPAAYEPQFEYASPIDLFYKDNDGDGKHLISERHSFSLHNVVPSPSGKYVLFFKDGHWFSYDVVTKAKKNLTQGLGVRFDNEHHDMPGEIGAYGFAGWQKDDQYLVVYDDYDLWRINPNGQGKRLTRGRERGVRYRLAGENGRISRESNFDGWHSTILDLEAGLLLGATGNDGDTGFFEWDSKRGERAIVYKAARIDQPIRQNGTYAWREQRFDKSPVIMTMRNGKPKIAIRSNLHQNKFYWGRSERVDYTTAEGKKLKGFLCIPGNYQEGKKYPMIVHIYQRQFRDFHTYVNPSIHSSVGYNVTAWLASGYLVLFPDIEYEIGKPGTSAVQCTVAATKAVIDKGIVDAGRVGLIGHSFGGYQTDFIITQTDLFKAAVAGAAATNLPSFYLTLNWSTGKPEHWRFEAQQWRMGKSLFEAWPEFQRESPLHHAHQVQTPILGWAGKKDAQVDWQQNIEFFLALRRLGKEHILLLYPDDSHVVTNPKSQEDLYRKVIDWFGHHLKGEPQKDWMLSK